MEKDAKWANYLGFIMVAIMFSCAYFIVNSQHDNLNIGKKQIKNLSNLTTEVCQYKGRYIQNCDPIDEGLESTLLKSFASSTPTLGPSKATKTIDKIIKFSGITKAGKQKCYCYNISAFKYIPDKIYFASLKVNSDCSKILSHQGSYLEGLYQGGGHLETIKGQPA